MLDHLEETPDIYLAHPLHLGVEENVVQAGKEVVSGRTARQRSSTEREVFTLGGPAGSQDPALHSRKRPARRSAQHSLHLH